MSAAFDRLLLRWIADTLHWYVHREDKKTPVTEGEDVKPDVRPPPEPPNPGSGIDAPIDSP
jgi:hypothetical protein